MTWPMWTTYRALGIGWFRIFGIGLAWKDITRHGLSFSERYGYKKGLQIGKWRLSFLAWDIRVSRRKVHQSCQ